MRLTLLNKLIQEYLKFYLIFGLDHYNSFNMFKINVT